jgi:hypothetical protein
MRSRPQRDRRRRLGAWAIRGAVLLIVFAAGLALGQALDDSSPPAGTTTSVRTLVPGTLSPATVTATVTVTTAP